MQPEFTQSPGVFISYRRSDSSFPASWLYGLLVEKFGPAYIFKDVDSIQPGDDFVEAIRSSVMACHTMLVVIGSNWLGVGRQIDVGNDFVRLEVEVALANGLRVIPLLIDDARMPTADELPASIAALARRNAITLSPNHFEADVQRLIPVIERAQQDAQRRATVAASRTASLRRAQERDRPPPQPGARTGPPFATTRGQDHPRRPTPSPTTDVQAGAAVVAQWIAGAIGGAGLWVGVCFLLRDLPIVALIAAPLVTIALVTVVNALVARRSGRITFSALLVGLMLTVSPAILILLVR